MGRVAILFGLATMIVVGNAAWLTSGSGAATALPPLVVSPSTPVQPGATVTISGENCGTSGGAHGNVTGSVAFPTPVTFSVPDVANPPGSWSASIVVPVDTPAGTYDVTAQCAAIEGDSTDVSGQAFGTYPAGQIVAVVAAQIPTTTTPAPAVVAGVTFTG
jgi:hypothetical protein